MKYGIDIIDQEFLLAGCNYSGGGTKIDCLNHVDVKDLKAEMITDDSDLLYSVPEDKAIIKRVKIPTDKNLDKKELAEFEFVSTLIDKNDDLYINSGSVNGGSEYLVFGCHKDIIDKKSKYFEDNLIKPTGYKLRAMALADGYHNFCWHEGGELICLIDLSPSYVSYCFTNKGDPIFVGSITNSNTDDVDNKNISDSFFADIKATIQYQTANLFKAGYSTPLSLIVVSGALTGKKSNEIFEEKLKLRTISPTIKTALFAPDIVDRAGQFLVSLGLTVNN